MGYYSNPSFEDIDNDGDKDLFIGALNGTILHYKNTSAILPLTLLNFNGSRHTGYNMLAWSTASEENTQVFNVQVSMDNGVENNWYGGGNGQRKRFVFFQPQQPDNREKFLPVKNGGCGSQLITSPSFQLPMLNYTKGIYLLKFEDGRIERVMKN